MIDARRMEVYAAIYDRALKPVRDIAADIVDETLIRNFWINIPFISLETGQPSAKIK